MSTGDDWRETFRPDIPSPARMYNYFLGGKDHFEADRKAAEQVIAAFPEVRAFARENRAFLRRAVRFLVRECGIRQIIDIGTGLPSKGNVHEVAQECDPDVRVVYVDHDPVVLAHGRNMLNGVPGTAIIGRDLLDPAEILADEELLELIDFTEPAAVLLIAVLHFIGDDAHPADLIDQLVRPLAPGSYVALTYPTSDSRPQEAAAAERIYRGTTTGIHARTRDQVAALLGDDLELVEPGLVWGPSWGAAPGATPGGAPGSDPKDCNMYAVVARKP
ncbi:MAG: SAM-dependent methyltransferase [Streptosporangiaceae bacterium]